MALLECQPRAGVSLGRGHLGFGRYVVSLTRPGRPRMPNGIEVDLEVPAGAPVRIGAGMLATEDASVRPGKRWDPVPHEVRPGGPALPPDGLLDRVGLGDGLTPYWDDVLAGYLAGLALLQGRRSQAQALAARAAPRTTSLSSTLLLHAARGEVPEPVHGFLARGDREPLLVFGHSSGRGWLAGLELAGAAP